MKQIESIRNLTELVSMKLATHTHLRDNDNRLIATVWSVQFGGKENLKLMTAFDLLQCYCLGQLSSAESIRRCRQKVQEMNPSLRGEHWHRRQVDGTNFAKEI